MLTYRTFRNSDPPALAALWRSRAGQPGLVQPVSPDLLEQLVFSRLYFDYGGLAWRTKTAGLSGSRTPGLAQTPTEAGFRRRPALSAWF
jgi:hypothetical protein